MIDPIANRAHIAAEISRLERRQNGGIPAATARDWIVELVAAQDRHAFTAADITAACSSVEAYVRDPHRPLRDRGARAPGPPPRRPVIARRAGRSAADLPRLESIPVPRPRRGLRTLTVGLVLVALVWTALRLAWALGGLLGGAL